jgi:hypothetical protein
MLARGLLLSCAILASACGKPDRATRIERALRTLCGDRYRAAIEDRDALVSGCRTEGEERPGTFAWYDVSAERKRVTVAVNGDEASLPASVKAVTAAVAPLLDAEQREIVAQELPMLIPDRFRPYERPVHHVAISASTWTRDLPWDRHARLTLDFDVQETDPGRPPMATMVETMGEQFGWSDHLGTLDDPPLASWKTYCAGGTWSAGDVWGRCVSPDLTYWAEWVPRSRRLLRARVEARGDLTGPVEALVFPLLTDEQRAKVREGLAADLDNTLEATDVFVRSEHRDDHHAISIDAEYRH